jgi:hypothetical protein
VENMERKSIKWRERLLRQLDTTLILFELILSVIFISIGHITDNNYIRGVGVGLVIYWVTSALAYLYKKKTAKP